MVSQGEEVCEALRENLLFWRPQVGGAGIHMGVAELTRGAGKGTPHPTPMLEDRLPEDAWQAAHCAPCRLSRSSSTHLALTRQ